METSTARRSSTAGAVGASLVVLAVEQASYVWPQWLWWVAIVVGTGLTAVSVITWIKVLADWLSPGWFALRFGGKMLAPSLMIAFGLYCLAFGGAWYAFTAKDFAAVAAKPAPEPKKTFRFARGQDVEFDDFLLFEFPSHGATYGKRFQATKLGRVHFATFFTLYPPNIRAEFYVIHIPKDGFAYEVAEFVAQNYKQLREDQGAPNSKADRRIPEDVRKALGILNETRNHYIGEKVPFTGQIYIYHEPNLTKGQKDELYDLFVKQNLVVEFRGPKHIAKMWADHGPRKE